MSVKYNPTTRTVSNVIFNIDQKKIIIKPDFQREIVWKESIFRDELMKSIFLGFPIGVFTLYDDEEKEYIIDGLQRIDTIKSFWNGNKDHYFAINAKISKLIVNEHKDIIQKAALEGDENSRLIMSLLYSNRGFRLKKDNLPAPLLQLLGVYQLNFNYILNATLSDIRDYFIVVQNQEKLKAGEIIKSIDDNELVDLIKEFNNLKSQFKEISFNNTRGDFTKYCVLFAGVYQQKIKFGVTDKIILKYGKKMNLSPELKLKFQNFLSSLDKANFLLNEYDRQFNKISMKLLIGYSLKYIEKINSFSIVEIVQKLYFLAEELSKFNSINDNRRNEINGSNNKDYIEKLKKISIISKTSHSLEKVEEALEILDLIFSTNKNFKLDVIRKNYIDLFIVSPSRNLKTKKNGWKPEYEDRYKEAGFPDYNLKKMKEYAKK